MLSEAYIKSKKNLDNCDFAIFSMQNPPEINPVNLGDSINSPLSEYFPSITVDNQTFLFTRRDKDDNSPSGYNENFYVSIKKNNEWGAAINLSNPVNTAFNEGAPSLSADGNILIFNAYIEIFIIARR